MDDDEESSVTIPTVEKPTIPLLKSSKRENRGCFVYILTFFAAVGGFLFGYDTGVISGALIILKKHFDLTFFMEELVVSITIGCAIFGAVFSGPMSQYLGRKFVLILSAVVFTAGALVMGLSGNKETLLVGRAIVGLGIGRFLFKISIS